MGGSTKGVRTISQEAFEGLVSENMEDLGMDPEEALEDAIQTLTLQRVDLYGIVMCIPGVTSVKENPVVHSLDELKNIAAGLVSSRLPDFKDKLSPLNSGGQNVDTVDGTVDLEEMGHLLDKICALCSIEGSGNASIATKNGGVELVNSICSALHIGYKQPLASALKTLASLLHDLQSTETFRQNGGPKIVVDILNDCNQNINILDSGFAVVAAAATGNEILKESFMDLKIDDLFVQFMKGHTKSSIQSLFDAIHVLLTPDDGRVLASQVYGYARRFARSGIAGALVDELHEGISSPSLVSASIALKAVAVNDEICKSVAENGGIDAILKCIDDSGERHNKEVAQACCSLLSKLGQSPSINLGECVDIFEHQIRERSSVLSLIWLPVNSSTSPKLDHLGGRLAQVQLLALLSGSDANKSAIVQKGGLDRLMKLSSRFSEDPSILQEIMSIICTLSLRSPENAARAIEAGAGDFAMQAMQKFPFAYQMQNQSCLMIRNLVVRNSENRTILLSHGIEKIIRKAKENHKSCKDAATAALRDLGLDNYNS